jgi:hypothetical protein
MNANMNSSSLIGEDDMPEVSQPAAAVPDMPASVSTSTRGTRKGKKEKPYVAIKTQVARAHEKKLAKRAAKADKKGGIVKPVAGPVKKGAGPAKPATRKVLKAKAPSKKPVEKEGSSSNGSNGKCSICGKLLSRHSSVSNGMGDTCAAKLKMLPKGFTDLKEHYQSFVVVDPPSKEYIKLKEAVDIARSKGVTLYRFLTAVGGNRMLRPPLNENFQIIVYKNCRYVPKASVSDKELKPLK